MVQLGAPDVSASGKQYDPGRALFGVPADFGGSHADRGREVNRELVGLGAILLVMGLLWAWLKKLHLFHLPGDIVIDRAGFKLFLPITSMVILSVLLSVMAWLMRR